MPQVDFGKMMKLDGPSQEPANGGPADALVVFLHGLGADGNDLIGLAPPLSQILPGAAFVSPDAPFPCDMAPMGRQWFSFQDMNPEAIVSGMRLAAPMLDAFLDRELERHGLGDDRLALVGFSQGTMMSLHVALRRPRPCAQVVGFSGALVGANELAGEIKCRPPVLLVHGDADPVVPVQSLPVAVQALKDNDVPVESMVRPRLAHGIDPQGLSAAAAVLRRSLGGPAEGA